MTKKKNIVEEAHEFYCEYVFAIMRARREKEKELAKQRKERE